MKKNILIILIAIILASTLTLFIIYKFNIRFKIDKNLITVFQIGVYKNKINALSEAKKYNGIVHQDDGYYRVYVAAYQDEAIIEKMEKYYNANNQTYYLRKIKTDNEYISTINKYEKLLQNSNDDSIYENLNNLLVSKLKEYL